MPRANTKSHPQWNPRAEIRQLTVSQKIAGGVILILSILAYLTFCYYAQNLRLSGDESYYFPSSARFTQIVEAVFNGQFNLARAKWDSIVNRGMFIPATSLVAAPMHWITSNIDAHRQYLFVANVLLHIFILYLLWKEFGLLTATVFHIVTLFIPVYSIFALTYWGEPFACRIMIILFLLLMRYYKDATKDNLKSPILFGILLALIVYFRNSMIVLCPMVIFFFAIKFLVLDKERKFLEKFKRFAVRSLVTTLVFCGLFLPWSYSLSKKFGCCYLTTTTIDSGVLERFGKKEILKKIKKNGRPNVVQVHNYYERLSKTTGESYASLIKEDLKITKQSKNWDARYKIIMRNNISKSVLEGRGFLRRVRSASMIQGQKEPPDRRAYYKFIYQVNTYVWYALMIGVLISLLLFFITSWELVIIKWIVYLACIQILFIGGSSRHHIILIPLFAMQIILQVKAVLNPTERETSKLAKILSAVPLLFFALAWIYYSV